MSKKVICPSCNLVLNLQNQDHRLKEYCPRCNSLLNKKSYLSIKDTAPIAIGALILLFFSINQPFLSISKYTLSYTISLYDIFTTLNLSWGLLLYLFLIFTFFCPIWILLSIIFIGLFNIKPNRFACICYKICYRFCMVEVFVFGIIVSLVKLTSLTEVYFHIGFFIAIIYSILILICTYNVRPKHIWELLYKSDYNQLEISKSAREQGFCKCVICNLHFNINEYQSCPRCKAKITNQIYNKNTYALIISALILYIPSNIYPIMYTTYLGRTLGSNIIDGVLALWDLKSYFVAIIILLASIFIPMFKILTLIALLYASKKQDKIKHKRVGVVLYNFIEFIGRWSMIDVFVVIIMTTTVKFSGLANINPGFAVICFSAVVILTMYATESFDKTSLWNKK